MNAHQVALDRDNLPAWAATYIGIPWVERGRSREGCDCWGLAVMIYHDVFGIDLPDYVPAYQTVRDRVTIARLFFSETTSPRWRRVALAEAKCPDVLSLWFGGDRHVGVLLTPGRFLHVLSGRQTCVERIHPHWTQRIDAIYRHEALR